MHLPVLSTTRRRAVKMIARIVTRPTHMRAAACISALQPSTILCNDFHAPRLMGGGIKPCYDPSFICPMPLTQKNRAYYGYDVFTVGDMSASCVSAECPVSPSVFVYFVYD